MSAPPGREGSIGGEPRQVVRSPDAVELDLELAGPTSRMLAYALDALLLYTVLLAFFLVAFASAPVLARLGGFLQEWAEALAGVDPDTDLLAVFWLPFLLLILVSVFAEMLYFTACELLFRGRTPGKRSLGLQVMRDGGLPLTVGASLVRNLLRVVDILPSSYLVGFVAMCVQREGKRLGDLAGGTVVVRLDRAPTAAPLRVSQGRDRSVFNLGRDHVERLGREGRALVRQTLRRLDGLDAERAEEALERACRVLCERIGFSEAVPAEERRAFLEALWRASLRR